MTEMLTVRQAAARACVSESLVRAWVAGGSLPCYRVGKAGHRGKILIAAGDLDGAMAGFKVGPAGPAPAGTPRPRPAHKHIRV